MAELTPIIRERIYEGGTSLIELITVIALADGDTVVTSIPNVSHVLIGEFGIGVTPGTTVPSVAISGQTLTLHNPQINAAHRVSLLVFGR